MRRPARRLALTSVRAARATKRFPSLRLIAKRPPSQAASSLQVKTDRRYVELSGGPPPAPVVHSKDWWADPLGCEGIADDRRPCHTILALRVLILACET